MSQKQSAKLFYIEGWLSITGNVLLFFLKFWAGLVSGSIAIISDAWHTLTDSLTSIIVIIGGKISHKPADKEHPFGHGRAELISSIIIGVILSVIAFHFLIESSQRLVDHHAAEYGLIAIWVTIVSIVVKEGMAQFAFWAGKKANSRSMKADGWHHRSDAISSVIILAGIFIGKYFWWIDGVMGLLVSLILFYASFDILRDTVSSLIGECSDEELIKQVSEISHDVTKRVIHLHHIHTHSYGNHTEMTFHIKLPGEISLTEAHEIASDIEEAVLKQLNIEVTIHMEPIESY